jgi:hypothetical protein
MESKNKINKLESELYNSRDSYLMTNINNINIPQDLQKNINIKINIYTNFHKDLIHLPNYLSESELEPLEQSINNIRKNINLSMFNEKTVGHFTIESIPYKYICHQKGRYDIWNIANEIKIPDILQKFTRKSIGGLLVDANTLTDGVYHKDTVELFETISNAELPPFYYNMLIALSEQTIDNAPTQFIIDDKNDNLYWVPMKRGDAIIFNGNLIHRGSANITNTNRDMIYAIFTTAWYDEEKL